MVLVIGLLKMIVGYKMAEYGSKSNKDTCEEYWNNISI